MTTFVLVHASCRQDRGMSGTRAAATASELTYRRRVELRQLEAFAAVATELDSGGRTRSCISDNPRSAT